MKKLLCLLMALISVLSLAACGGNGGDEPTSAPAETTTCPEGKYSWPDSKLFADIPALADFFDYYKESKNDQGYVYEFCVEDLDYKAYREYILELEKSGFKIYDPTDRGLIKTEDKLPEKLAEEKFNATWAGSKHGLYLSSFWYGDEYFAANEIEKSYNVRLTFYTYNAFDIEL